MVRSALFFFSCSANHSCRQARNNITYSLSLHGVSRMTVIAYFQVQTVTHCCMQSKVLPKVTSSSSRLQMALLPQYGWHWILISHNDDPSNWLTNFILRLQVHKWPLQVQQYLQGSYSKKKGITLLQIKQLSLCNSSNRASFSLSPFPCKKHNSSQFTLKRPLAFIGSARLVRQIKCRHIHPLTKAREY